MRLLDFVVLGMFFCVCLLVNTFCFTNKKTFNFAISSVVSLTIFVFFLRGAPKLLAFSVSSYYVIGLIAICLLLGLYGYFQGSIPGKENNLSVGGRPVFSLESIDGKKISFGDPFDNFLVYAGANAGKTKSIGKPLLEQYIQHGFAGMVYDYKDFDYTTTAYNLIKKHHYKYPFYYISFTDMQRTYRFNPIKPSVVADENLLMQLIDDILSASLGDGSKKDEWYFGALGIFKGTAVRFFKEFPRYCTLPHIVNFIVHSERQQLYDFLKSSRESKALASGYLDAQGSERTQASILSSLTNYISSLAFNKKVAYVLSGDDFDFNLIDPENPKLVAVSNSYAIESTISPIIALMISVSSRHFSMQNKVPFVYFWDEATTFKIRDFEKMPSVLREYLCSFVFLTQSGAKIEKNYGKLDRSSIESNFSNLFLGRTKDTEALKTYGMHFSKKEEIKRTDSSGYSSHGDNRSVSVSKTEKDRYDPYFYTGLQAGEFVGSAAHSNLREFHMRFKQYQGQDLEALPVVNMIFEKDVEQNYQRILNDIDAIHSEMSVLG